jgi:exopolyphosphatase / guanosine-5'-triphosphate,3'-diphosphate pyrophosphatase
MKTTDTLAQESLALRARYDEEPSHSDHVCALALQIYDGLGAWHKLEARSRELLHSAALLHDIGWSQTPDGKGHHKWSAKLIQEHPWKSLTKDETQIVAHVARYHRKAPPQPDHTEFHALKPAAQKLVMILGGILRIADALDRTHTQKVTRLEAAVTKEAIIVRVQPDGNWNAERVTFEMKSDMLQAATQREIHCEEIRG